MPSLLSSVHDASNENTTLKHTHHSLPWGNAMHSLTVCFPHSFCPPEPFGLSLQQADRRHRMRDREWSRCCKHPAGESCHMNNSWSLKEKLQNRKSTEQLRSRSCGSMSAHCCELTELLHHKLSRGRVVEALGELRAIPHQQLLMGQNGLDGVEVDVHATLTRGQILLLLCVCWVHIAHPVALVLIQPVHKVVELPLGVDL